MTTEILLFEHSTSEKLIAGHLNAPPVPAQKSGSKLAPEKVSQTLLIKTETTDDAIH